MAKKKKKQKQHDNEEAEEIFDCWKECFNVAEENKPQICVRSPCPLNLEKFGTHTRIIQSYLTLEDWDSAYYYLDDLTSQSSFDCDVSLLYNVRKNIEKPKLTDLPLGCRVFKLEDKLNKMLNILNDYKNKKNLSQSGTENYEQMKVEFRQKILGNLKTLKHITMDKRNRKEDDLYYKEILLELYAEARMARKEGVDVETGVGSAAEGIFEYFTDKTGLKTMTAFKHNIERGKDWKQEQEKLKKAKELKEHLDQEIEKKTENQSKESKK